MMAAEKKELRGDLLFDQPLARLTTWRAGGAAECLYRPTDLDDLCLFLAGLPADEPLTWLGMGSNLLVRDGGVRGTVITLQGALTGLGLEKAGRVRAEAGVPCAKVARFCAVHDLADAEFLVGIPGSVGGALAMNAGAFGGAIWEWVAQVETIDRRGGIHERRPNAFEIGYRSVSGPADEWFVAAHLALPAGNRDTALRKIGDLLAGRARTQPLGVASCGSVFRNPSGDHAARVIEAAGLKGFCIGAACVSGMHANFIVNTGGARAADIEALIGHVQREVEQRFGVRLEPEVRIVGEAL